MCADRSSTELFSLETQRLIPASPEQVFAAWTLPDQLIKWWGPKDISCIGAEIDLTIGGRYRIGNSLPDKSTVWIEGVFEQIERPHILVFTWGINGASSAAERVAVRFESDGDGTLVSVKHERIESTALRDQHQEGWHGCLRGLFEYLTG